MVTRRTRRARHRLDLPYVVNPQVGALVYSASEKAQEFPKGGSVAS